MQPSGVHRVARLAAAAALLLLLTSVGQAVDQHLRAAAFLLRFEADNGEASGLATYGASEVTRREVAVRGERALLYAPEGDTARAGVVLVHGIHPQGIDERRLTAFANNVAATGIVVLTPEMPSLARFEVAPDAPARIAGAAAWLADELGREQVAVFGISFSGGLALLAAAEAEERDRIGLVLSIGGHCDMVQVTRFYLGEPARDADGRTSSVAPHPYGAAVFMYRFASELFAPHDLAVARRMLDLILNDRPDLARPHLADLSPEGRADMTLVLDRTDDARLRAKVLPVLARHEADLLRASPRGRLGAVRAQVFLVHGADDPVVPSTEASWLARDVPAAALQAVVISDALRHAEYEREPTNGERWQLLHFMAQVLRATRSAG